MKLSENVAGLKNSDIRKWTLYIETRGAINLAQGICHVEPSNEKKKVVATACAMLERGLVERGYNSYAHFSGIPKLRQVIAQKAKAFNGLDVHPDTEVLVTDGASGAFSCAVSALTNPGDEIILFEPYYEYHASHLRSVGRLSKTVRLRPPNWSFTLADLEAAWSERTKAIVVNTPANPSGKVFSEDELSMIASFCEKKDIFAVTDEVYEFMTFDGLQHRSLAALPGMWKRTVTINSFSKPLSITGWRVGYSIAPRELTQAMGYYNEFGYVCAPTPLQHAIAEVFGEWSVFTQLSGVYQAKRDILCNALRKTGLSFYEPKGAFYVLVDISSLQLGDDVAANTRLIDDPGIGGVPAHDLYTDESGRYQIRLCYAIEDALLRDAADRLRRLAREYW